MEIFTFTDINSVLLPIGVFVIFLAIWQFGSDYAKEGILQLFIRSFKGAYTMIVKFFAYLGYVAFGLMIATLGWIIVSAIYTLLNSEGTSVAIIVVCVVLLLIFIVPFVLMIWRAILNKKGVPVWKGEVPVEDRAVTIGRCLSLIEDNNKTINRILTILERGSNERAIGETTNEIVDK